jgi:putative inorganic carbon (hco3(-)) transporter
MFRSLYLTLVYGTFLCAGLVAPFVLGLGYVWVDTFTPQNIAYSILTEFPISLVMGSAAVLAYILQDRRAPPRFYTVTILIILMGLWVTFTTFNAPVAPELARTKWDWAVKTIIFSAFMPFLFRSRVQIEAFLLVYIFSLMGQLLPFAGKTILSGGGYGTSYGLVAGNSGVAEGAHLAAVAMLIVPLLLFLRRFGVVLPRIPLVRLMYLGMAVACFPAAVGTYERTAIIGMAVVLLGLWVGLRQRMLYGLIGAAALAIVVGSVLSSDSPWVHRMMTIGTYSQDSSAVTRLEVWRWTLDFVREHPLGGGFYAHYTNTITIAGTADAPDPIVQHGRAAHSIWFEVLGEHGWPGLALFLGLFTASLLTLRGAARRARDLPGMEWCVDLAKALQLSLVVAMACGTFIGIAFQPEIYYLFALAVMIRHQVDVVAKLQRPSVAATQFDLETGMFEIGNA